MLMFVSGETEVDDLRYVPKSRLEGWGVPLKLKLA